MVTELKNCRVCGSENINDVLDLGNVFPSSFLKDDENLEESSKSPLTLCKCDKCGLVQLRHTIDLDLMYRQYWYSSSLNRSMVSSLQNVVMDALNHATKLKTGDTVIDIGCNDGTMLNMYPDTLTRIGYDPALNLKKPEGIYFYNNYFSSEGYFDLYGQVKAKIITAIAMFYDLPDPIKFAKEVASVLADDGIFVVQFTDLFSMFNTTAFDNICHEHLEYYTLRDVVNILNEAGLRVIDVSYNDVNGGSIRVTSAHRESSFETSEIVVQTLVDEFNYFSTHNFEWFANNIRIVKEKIAEFLKWCKFHGHTVHIMGASTKGNTLLQICNITSDDVQFAAEVNPDKFGLRTAGTNIKIISQEDSLIMHPTHYIVPVWHFKNSLVNNERIQSYLKSNGALVFPLPYFSIIKEDGEFRL